MAAIDLDLNAEGTAARGDLRLDGTIAPVFTLLGSASPLAPGTSADGSGLAGFHGSHQVSSRRNSPSTPGSRPASDEW